MSKPTPTPGPWTPTVIRDGLPVVYGRAKRTPEMLEALRTIEVLLAIGPGHKLLDIPEVRVAWDRVREAIAKADGHV